MTISILVDGVYVGPAEALDDPMFLSHVDIPVDVRTCFKYEPGEGDDPEKWTIRWTRLRNIVASIVDMRESYPELKFFLHCHGGVDRAPFVAAVLVSEVTGWDDPRRSYEYVAFRRPQTKIHEDWLKEWSEAKGISWIEILTSES